MSKLYRGLLQGQSKVLVLTELGDVCEWVVVVVTKFRGGRGDDASAILVMIDKEGVTHPDELELPSDDIRRCTSARDLLEANKSIAREEADELINASVLTLRLLSLRRFSTTVTTTKKTTRIVTQNGEMNRLRSRPLLRRPNRGFG